MSTVLARNRSLSAFEYYNTALEIRRKVTALVTSSAVPKSYRFIVACPMAETARSLVFNLVKANAFYPNSERGVEERRRFMTLAVADCEQLAQDLQLMASMGLPVRVARFEALLEDIDREIRLIKGARKGVRLIGRG